jgi:short-subunit dehydrogenase
MTPDPITDFVRRTVLITGASSGIGEAFADVFAGGGFDLVITARREDRLQLLAGRIRQRHGVRVHVITADLSDRSAPARLCDEVVARGLTIDALVNNAGYGVPGAYSSSPWDRHEALLQVMVTGLAELTYRLLPPMVERGYGRIINVASLAGLVPAAAGHTLYAASKAFVIRFSEALGHEVADRGVHVTALCPGFTYSEFHDRTGTREKVSRLPRFLWMDAATVARQGYDAVMDGDALYVNGRVNRTIAALVRYLPHTIVTAAGRRMGKLYRKSS